MFTHLFSGLLILGAAAVCLVAFWKGDSAARIASIINILNAAALPALRIFLGYQTGEVVQLASDFGASIGFLLLAVRFASMWLGAAMLLQSGLFSLHAFYLVTDRPHDRLHAWINNTDQWALYLCILLGVVLDARRRAAAAREAAEIEARRQQRSSRRK